MKVVQRLSKQGVGKKRDDKPLDRINLNEAG